MEVSLQTDFLLEQQYTRRKLRPTYMQRDKDPQNSSLSVELPSIRRHHRIFNNIPESPALKPTGVVSPTRFPSIFKKCQPSP